MEPLYFANALSVGFSAVLNIIFGVFLFRVSKKTSKVPATILFSVCLVSLFLITSFIELFGFRPFISHVSAFFGAYMLLSFLLTALTVPDKSLTIKYWPLFVIATFVAVLVSVPGLGYEAIIFKPKGYVELLPGPYISIVDGYALALVIATPFAFLYRAYRDKDIYHRYIFKALGWGYSVYGLAVGVGIIILPLLGINYFTNTALAFSSVAIIGSFTYVYGVCLAKGGKLDRDLS